ncbi:MAG: hypothetical protein RG741_10780 [Bacteroidales bacterium]|nr:hypothetical protein [Bacteroidales bacterium]
MSIYNERISFIEETGILLESMGTTRMSGRILGYLMVTDKEMVSFDELCQVLQASKSSISTNVKTLITLHFIKPITLPGDRKTYYMLAPDLNWAEYHIKRIEQLKHMNRLFRKALELRVNKNDKSSRWLKMSVEFYEWATEGYKNFLKQWTGKKPKE